MATQKQKRAVEELVENGGSVSRAMVRAGYSPATAHTPSKLTRSKGFQEFKEICAELGLDAELIIKSLAENIRGKPMDRVNELLLAAKILGLLEKAKQEPVDREMPIPLLNFFVKEDTDKIPPPIYGGESTADI